MIDSGEAVRKVALTVARFSGLAPLMRPFASGIGAILMLHRVTAHPEKPNGVNRHLNIAPAFLDALLADLKRRGYLFVSMDEAVDRIVSRARDKFAAITADDAYRDNLTEALPVLEKHEAPIAIYAAPSLINGSSDLWWELVEDIVAARDDLYVPTAKGRVHLDCSSPSRKYAANVFLHDYLTRDVPEEDQRHVVRELARSVGVDSERPRRQTLMTWDELRTIAAHPLATIGAHTVNHYNLKRLSEEKAYAEMTDSARILNFELGVMPRHLAYPYGYPAAVCEREVALAKAAGFASAVTTRHGVLRAEHARHLHALPRISVNGRYQRVAHIRTMLSGVTTPLANYGKLLVTV
jgi:peptidoglycan/xylan/chitin deacetylase (PgdA/CDA1 family)